MEDFLDAGLEDDEAVDMVLSDRLRKFGGVPFKF